MERAADLPVDTKTLRMWGGNARSLSVQLSRWTRQGKLVPLRRGIDLRPPRGAIVETTLVHRFFPVSSLDLVTGVRAGIERRITLHWTAGISATTVHAFGVFRPDHRTSEVAFSLSYSRFARSLMRRRFRGLIQKGAQMSDALHLLTSTLYFFRDHNQDGTGHVTDPSVIAKWVGRPEKIFSGGNGIIYSIWQRVELGIVANLIVHRDSNQNGTGQAVELGTIGHGGWNNFQFAFSGENGLIYAILPKDVVGIGNGGDLLVYRDTTQDGTGEAVQLGTIGHGGWNNFRFVFSGGNGLIYAILPKDVVGIGNGGDLIVYKDTTQDGTGEAVQLGTIGHGGWNNFRFVFSDGNGLIYAILSKDVAGIGNSGDLIVYRDTTQDGTGEAVQLGTIGHDGWNEFQFVFSGGKGCIYAVAFTFD